MVSLSQTRHIGDYSSTPMTVMMENPIATHGITETNAAIVNGSLVTLAAEPSALESDSTKSEKFKPDVHFWLAFSPLTVLVVMVALDGTSLSVALPVRPRPLYLSTYIGHLYLHGSTKSGHFQQPTRHRHRGVLDWNQLPP
jgi:hypothetical protein